MRVVCEVVVPIYKTCVTPLSQNQEKVINYAYVYTLFVKKELEISVGGERGRIGAGSVGVEDIHEN